MAQIIKRMTKKELKEKEIQNAIAALKQVIKPGQTVFTEIDTVSRSGMSRSMWVYIHSPDGIGYVDITDTVALITENRLTKRGSLHISGCGMDMGFALVYSLSSRMYREGYNCTGFDSWTTETERKQGLFKCMSNQHYGENRKPYSTTVIHNDGYALKHEWKSSG